MKAERNQTKADRAGRKGKLKWYLMSAPSAAQFPDQPPIAKIAPNTNAQNTATPIIQANTPQTSGIVTGEVGLAYPWEPNAFSSAARASSFRPALLRRQPQLTKLGERCNKGDDNARHASQRCTLWRAFQVSFQKQENKYENFNFGCDRPWRADFQRGLCLPLWHASGLHLRRQRQKRVPLRIVSTGWGQRPNLRCSLLPIPDDPSPQSLHPQRMDKLRFAGGFGNRRRMRRLHHLGTLLWVAISQ